MQLQRRARTLKLSDPQLVQARAIQEDLKGPASEHTSLPPRAGSVLSYYLRDENGTRALQRQLRRPARRPSHELALFVLQTAQQVCHLPHVSGGLRRAAGALGEADLAVRAARAPGRARPAPGA